MLFLLWQFNHGLSIVDQVGLWAEDEHAPAFVDASFAIELATRSPRTLRKILAKVAALLGQECLALRTLHRVEFELIFAPVLTAANEEA